MLFCISCTAKVTWTHFLFELSKFWMLKRNSRRDKTINKWVIEVCDGCWMNANICPHPHVLRTFYIENVKNQFHPTPMTNMTKRPISVLFSASTLSQFSGIDKNKEQVQKLIKCKFREFLFFLLIIVFIIKTYVLYASLSVFLQMRTIFKGWAKHFLVTL